MHRVAGNVFLNVHVCVRHAVEVDNLETLRHDVIGDSSVPENYVLVLDHLTHFVLFENGHIVKGRS